MVLGKLLVPGCPTIWIIEGQGSIALAKGAGGDRLDIFTLLYLFSVRSPSLWETARYRLKYCLKGPKYCLKGPLNPEQPTIPTVSVNLKILRPVTYSSNWFLEELLYLKMVKYI